jgi:phenylalanyl-tRNA synthetase beta chain
MSGLAQTAKTNANQGERSIALFCSGRVFWRDGSSEAEGLRLGGLLCGQPLRKGVRLSESESDFFDVKGVVENLLDYFSAPVEWSRVRVPFLHPGNGTKLSLRGALVGYVGGLPPQVQEAYELPQQTWVFELDVDTLLEYPPRRSFRELPRFPAVTRDLAILVGEEFAAGEVIEFVRKWESDWIESVELFDHYKGAQIPEGRRSLAFSIVYRAADRTLTDDEVNELHDRLTNALTSALGVEMRR